ncbi:conjugal transfer protein [Spirosoma sordidisoli]|uniref:Conjugal transfer protein n=2 Tax=Spirosoma sordidisoli TaxID=2502893 RepID=A0A4V1RVK2_9BACT|nr:conjugal transfer protein [Spirosoma sordidisoli]
MVQSKSSGHAKAYFSESLVRSDYYLSGQDQEISGRLQGKLAERLGLAGPVTKEVFFDLCENINPTTGGALTPITKHDRTVGYDINFHCPKSVSIIQALSPDNHIQEAFQEAVRQTMLDIENDAKTRVRKDGIVDERQTSELLWADFTHLTARPVEGHTPDPHLHMHCFVMNATWDAEEQQVKAVQFRDIKRDMPFYQSRFHKRLADNLIDLGYQIQRTDKSFELTGVPENVIDLFSKRTDEIGRVAEAKGITNPDELGALGARTRAKKQKGLTMAELKDDWKRQISELGKTSEKDGKQILRYAPVQDKEAPSPQRCVDHAIEHGFERASVAQDRRLLAEGYRHSLGHRSVSLDEITSAFAADERLIHVTDAGRTLTTTKTVLREEQHMVNLARQGLGKLKPLYAQAPELTLEGQQADAVTHVLTTTNRVSIIRGAAGSGKTTLMKEAIGQMEKAGKTVTVVAPTAQASRGVLRDEGFDKAETVSLLLSDPRRQDALKGQVLWVDEAGLLGNADMTALLELANKQNARLILGGDTRQHSAVVRGDALRILNTVAGIKTAEVNKIYRQRDTDYRAAVEDLAKGNVASGFGRLDDIGFIENVDPLKPHQGLVHTYADVLQRGKSALVVSPTHEQSDAITNSIRTKLKEGGLLGQREIQAKRYTNLNLTAAERADWRNFKPGHKVQFNQNVPGFKRGSLWQVKSSTKEGVEVVDEHDQMMRLPLDKANYFDVLRQSEIALAKGDKVRITRNGFDMNGNRLSNGQLLDVVKVSKNGPILLRNETSKVEYTLKQDFGHIAHSYCVTSHASQGKTVDEVLLWQPAATFPGTDAKQFYVSVSRGRDRARIFTDDKDELLNYAKRLGDRQSALELVASHDQTREHIQHRIREELNRTPAKADKGNAITKAPRVKDRDYEPKF